MPAKIVHVETGPTVTQFGVEPLYLERAGQRRKVRVNRIVALADDLALALAAPGRAHRSAGAGSALRGHRSAQCGQDHGWPARHYGEQGDAQGTAASDSAPGPRHLRQAGHHGSGASPHMLIAGQTGAGKSVCINTIICGLLMQHGPESLKFVMVDPKMVELPGYNGIPHLLGKAITDMEQVMGALTYLLLEMDDRYQLFREHGVRNIDAYNALAQTPQVHGAPALHRAHRRRTGRPDDDCGRGYRTADLSSGADGAGHRHPSDLGHATAQHRCGHRSDQGQFPDAYRFCRHQPDRQPSRSGPTRRRETARLRRHVAHARRMWPSSRVFRDVGSQTPRSRRWPATGRRPSTEAQTAPCRPGTA